MENKKKYPMGVGWLIIDVLSLIACIYILINNVYHHKSAWIIIVDGLLVLIWILLSYRTWKVRRI